MNLGVFLRKLLYLKDKVSTRWAQVAILGPLFRCKSGVLENMKGAASDQTSKMVWVHSACTTSGRVLGEQSSDAIRHFP